MFSSGNQANEDKARVSNMWEGVTFEETIQNEIHALKRVAAEADAKAAAEIAESEEETKMLTNYLLDNNRIEDLRHCANDPGYKQQLMEELGI